jgi:hypothetical protein
LPKVDSNWLRKALGSTGAAPAGDCAKAFSVKTVVAQATAEKTSVFMKDTPEF